MACGREQGQHSVSMRQCVHCSSQGLLAVIHPSHARQQQQQQQELQQQAIWPGLTG
jgi:hypothetical protein